MAVGGYDGMHLIYEALKKTGGKADGDSLIAAMKGLAWESPRGPVSIDPDTRDIVQNIYIRKVEKVGGELYNVEFATVEGGQGSGQGREEVSLRIVDFVRASDAASRPGPCLAGVGSVPDAATGPLIGRRARPCAHLSHRPQSPFFVP